MPTGPQGQKRPADAVAVAATVARIATGEVDESVDMKKSKLNRGTERARILAPSRPKAIAPAAAEARWSVS